MQSLPLVISLVIAAGVVSPVCRSLVELGLTQKNYRGTPVAFPAGIAIVVAAFLALVPLSLVQELAGADVFRPGLETALIYVVGVSLLGLLDDLIGSGFYFRTQAGAKTEQGEDAGSKPYANTARPEDAARGGFAAGAGVAGPMRRAVPLRLRRARRRRVPVRQADASTRSA